MLAVIQQQQRLAWAEVANQVRFDHGARREMETERRGDRFWHERWLSQWGEVDPAHAISEVVGNVLGDGEGQPCLADSTGSDQG
jgi:hypothetical protein